MTINLNIDKNLGVFMSSGRGSKIAQNVSTRSPESSSLFSVSLSRESSDSSSSISKSMSESIQSVMPSVNNALTTNPLFREKVEKTLLPEYKSLDLMIPAPLLGDLKDLKVGLKPPHAGLVQIFIDCHRNLEDILFNGKPIPVSRSAFSKERTNLQDKYFIKIILQDTTLEEKTLALLDHNYHDFAETVLAAKKDQLFNAVIEKIEKGDPKFDTKSTSAKNKYFKYIQEQIEKDVTTIAKVFKFFKDQLGIDGFKELLTVHDQTMIGAYDFAFSSLRTKMIFGTPNYRLNYEFSPTLGELIATVVFNELKTYDVNDIDEANPFVFFRKKVEFGTKIETKKGVYRFEICTSSKDSTALKLLLQAQGFPDNQELYKQIKDPVILKFMLDFHLELHIAALEVASRYTGRKFYYKMPSLTQYRMLRADLRQNEFLRDVFLANSTRISDLIELAVDIRMTVLPELKSFQERAKELIVRLNELIFNDKDGEFWQRIQRESSLLFSTLSYDFLLRESIKSIRFLEIIPRRLEIIESQMQKYEKIVEEGYDLLPSNFL